MNDSWVPQWSFKRDFNEIRPKSKVMLLQLLIQNYTSCILKQDLLPHKNTTI